jgi:class 3 adenylate cyclase
MATESTQHTNEAETADVKYVFLDVVGYTRGRSVEAQVEVISTLNRLVNEALKETMSEGDEVIFLPTGDGMAIAFVNPRSYEAHLRTAVRLVGNIHCYNNATKDETRRFEVRIGINENVDNIILDINGRRNVAGNGIAMAQRIMDKADGMQVLVAQSVFDRLSPRERYMNSFRPYNATSKHGVTFSVFQYIGASLGLNCEPPSAFKAKPVRVEKLSRLVGYYIADAAANRSFLVSKNDDGFRDESATVLLYFRAEDSVTVEQAKDHTDPVRKTWRGKQGSFEEQYAYYEDLDSWVLTQVAESLTAKLQPYAMCFDACGVFKDQLIFPSAEGIRRLKAECPDIAQKFKTEA